MTTDVNWYDVSRDLRAKNDRLEATNAALAARVQALEAALDAKIDDAARLRGSLEMAREKILEQEESHAQTERYLLDALGAAQAKEVRLRAALEAVEWHGSDNGWINCPWCNGREHRGHAPDCQRQAALAQTSEVKA